MKTQTTLDVCLIALVITLIITNKEPQFNAVLEVLIFLTFITGILAICRWAIGTSSHNSPAQTNTNNIQNNTNPG